MMRKHIQHDVNESAELYFIVSTIKCKFKKSFMIQPLSHISTKFDVKSSDYGGDVIGGVIGGEKRQATV